MGEMISQNHLFKYFVSSVYYLTGYNELKFQFMKNDVIDEKLLERQIDFYRRHKNFEKLIPLLLMTVHLQMEKKDDQLATIYLIECYSLLKRLDKHGKLVLYTCLELGNVLEQQQQYQESAFYYMKAVKFCIDAKADEFLSYSLNQLGKLTILSNTQKYASRFESLFATYESLHLSKELDACLAIERRFAKQNLESALVCIEDALSWMSETTEQWFKVFLAVRHVKCLYMLDKIDQIQWIDESTFEWTEDSVYEYYGLEYRLYQNKFKSYETYKRFATELQQMLQQTQKWYLLDLLYENLLTDQAILKDAVWYEQLHEQMLQNKNFINQREIKMKDRLQDIHSNYKEYYRQLEGIDEDSKVEYVCWSEFKQSYEANYSPSMTLISVSLDKYFYQDMPMSAYKKLVNHLVTLLSGDKTITQSENMIWVYFKAHGSHVSLKKRLGRIAEQLYKDYGEKFTFLACLPKYCTPVFEETKQKIYASFYCAMLQSTDKDDYQFSSYRKSNIQYDVANKIVNNLAQAKENRKFNIYPHYFYDVNSQVIQGVEFSNQKEEYLKIAELVEDGQQWIREILMTEVELLTLRMGCEYIKENFKNSDYIPSIFVKFSRESLLNKFTVTRIGSCVEAMNLEPHKVVIEIDENTMFEDNVEIKATINQLKKIGVNIALDEYGVGALTGSIRNVSINYLKLSEQMLNQLEANAQQRHILQPINKICCERNIKMCCSHIETENIHLLISDLGVNLASGAYYQ